MNGRGCKSIRTLAYAQTLLTVAVLTAFCALVSHGQESKEDITPPGSQIKLLSLRGKGEQIYISQAKTDEPGKFAWVLKEPKARLYDDKGKEVGKHYKGPTWEAKDQSKVLGKKLRQIAAPTPNAVPWLLLEVATHTGPSHGLLSKVTYIQRIDTRGGTPPSEAPRRAGIQKRVPYTATYVFWGTA